VSPRKNREEIMPRLILALALCCVALPAAAASNAKPAANDLSLCVDTWATLGAGGPVSDKELAAAQNACAHLQQAPQDDKNVARINAAAEAIAAEVKRRQAKH
jgi:hypothetical protein